MRVIFLYRLYNPMNIHNQFLLVLKRPITLWSQEVTKMYLSLLRNTYAFLFVLLAISMLSSSNVWSMLLVHGIHILASTFKTRINAYAKFCQSVNIKIPHVHLPNITCENVSHSFQIYNDPQFLPAASLTHFLFHLISLIQHTKYRCKFKEFLKMGKIHCSTQIRQRMSQNTHMQKKIRDLSWVHSED